MMDVKGWNPRLNGVEDVLPKSCSCDFGSCGANGRLNADSITPRKLQAIEPISNREALENPWVTVVLPSPHSKDAATRRRAPILQASRMLKK
jgi:hypothetical protein